MGVINRTATNSCRSSKSSSQIKGEKAVALLVLVIFMEAIQIQVSKVAGQVIPSPAPTPISFNRTAPRPAIAGVNRTAPAPSAVGNRTAPASTPAAENGTAGPPPLSAPLPVGGPPQPPSAPTATQQQQIQQVITSLRFNNYSTVAHYLAEYLFFIPLNSTLLVPTNEAFVPMRPSSALAVVLSYHTVLQQLSYQQIVQFPVNTRLKTLCANNTILITSAAPDNFRVDNVRVIEGNVCGSNISTLQITCHGVEAILNATEWGNAARSSVAPSPVAASAPRSIRAPTPALTPLSPNRVPIVSPSAIIPTFPSAKLHPQEAPQSPPSGVVHHQQYLFLVICLTLLSAGALVVIA